MRLERYGRGKRVPKKVRWLLILIFAVRVWSADSCVVADLLEWVMALGAILRKTEVML
jgi:hypothetical protein